MAEAQPEDQFRTAHVQKSIDDEITWPRKRHCTYCVPLHLQSLLHVCSFYYMCVLYWVPYHEDVWQSRGRDLPLRHKNVGSSPSHDLSHSCSWARHLTWFASQRSCRESTSDAGRVICDSLVSYPGGVLTPIHLMLQKLELKEHSHEFSSFHIWQSKYFLTTQWRNYVNILFQSKVTTIWR